MKTCHKTRPNLKWKLLAVALTACIIGLIFFIIAGKIQLNKKIKQLKEIGIPTSFADLEKLYPAAPGIENAAPLYEKAFAAMPDRPSNLKDFLSYTVTLENLTPPLQDDVRKGLNDYLDYNKDCLELLYEAAKIGSCHYKYNYQHTDLYLSRLNKTKSSLRLLTNEMYLHADNNDSNKLFDNLKTQIRLTESVNNDPLLTSFLVRSACWALTNYNIEYALNNIDFTTDQVSELQKLLPTQNILDDFRSALTNEQCYILEMIHNHKLVKKHYPDTHKRLLFSCPGLFERNCMKFLDLIHEYINIAELTPNKQLARLDTLSERKDFFPSSLNSIIRIPALNTAIKINLKVQTGITLTHTALAVEKFIIDNGNIPHSLDKLIPDYLEKIPVDLDGKPLRYFANPNSYTIYSINHDMTDQQGKKQDKDNRSKPHDIPFTVVKKK